MTPSFATPEELAVLLGGRIKARRLQRNMEQADLSLRAGVSIQAVRRLERGQGSSLETFLRVLKGLGALDALEAFLPAPSVNPLAMLDGSEGRQRARKRKGEP